MRKTLSTALLVLGLVVIATGAQAARQDNDGFLYGTVVTDSGKEYTGFLRWNADEEAFWDDLFHSAKTKLPYIDEVDRADRRRDRKKHTNIKIFGFRVNVESDDWAGDDSRVFIARFGDIERITVKGDDAARLDMKGGESLDVEGYANDVGATILVKDAGLGEIELHWDNIDTIRFAAAWVDAAAAVWRELEPTTDRALLDEYLALNGAADFCAGSLEPAEALARVDEARARLDELAQTLGDDALGRERALMEKLRENLNAGASRCGAGVDDGYY